MCWETEDVWDICMIVSDIVKGYKKCYLWERERGRWRPFIVGHLRDVCSVHAKHDESHASHQSSEGEGVKGGIQTSNHSGHNSVKCWWPQPTGFQEGKLRAQNLPFSISSPLWLSGGMQMWYTRYRGTRRTLTAAFTQVVLWFFIMTGINGM